MPQHIAQSAIIGAIDAVAEPAPAVMSSPLPWRIVAPSCARLLPASPEASHAKNALSWPNGRAHREMHRGDKCTRRRGVKRPVGARRESIGRRRGVRSENHHVRIDYHNSREMKYWRLR